MQAILKTLANQIFGNPGCAVSFVLGIFLGLWIAHRLLKDYIATMRSWVDDLKNKLSHQTEEIVELRTQNVNLKQLLEDALAQIVDEGPTVGEVALNSGNTPVPSATSDPSRRLEQRIESALEPEGFRIQGEDEEEDWEKMAARLVLVGINGQATNNLRKCMKIRGKGLVDRAGRECIHYLHRENKPIPVAILNRGNANHRVLFPDCTDRKVPVSSLRPPPELPDS